MSTFRPRAVLSALVLCAFVASTWADVPRMIHYQGKLRESGGALVNGTVALDFKLYGHETNPAPLLFEESHGSVSVTNGLFNVMIGSQTGGGVPDSALDAMELFLGISVNSGTELSPRPRIVSNPHAIKARNAEQLVKPGTFDAAATVDGSGQVGIGTAAPAAALDVDRDGGTVLLPRKSGTGDPTGVDGMIYYNTADGKFRGFENGSWGDLRDGSGSASDPCNCPQNPWTLHGVINSTVANQSVEVGNLSIADNSKEYLLLGVEQYNSEFTLQAPAESAVWIAHATNVTIVEYKGAIQDAGGAWRAGISAYDGPTYANRVAVGALWGSAGVPTQMHQVRVAYQCYARIYSDGTVRLYDSSNQYDEAIMVFSRIP